QRSIPQERGARLQRHRPAVTLDDQIRTVHADGQEVLLRSARIDPYHVGVGRIAGKAIGVEQTRGGPPALYEDGATEWGGLHEEAGRQFDGAIGRRALHRELARQSELEGDGVSRTPGAREQRDE